MQPVRNVFTLYHDAYQAFLSATERLQSALASDDWEAAQACIAERQSVIARIAAVALPRPETPQEVEMAKSCLALASECARASQSAEDAMKLWHVRLKAEMQQTTTARPPKNVYGEGESTFDVRG